MPTDKQPTGRRQNCELLMLADMVSLSRGEKPIYGKGEFQSAERNNPVKCIGAPGSNNWDRESAAIRYVLDWGRQFGQDPIRDVREIIEASKEKWGGREIDSSHYEDFTASADLLIQKASKSRTDGIHTAMLDHNTYRAARMLALWSTRAGAVIAVGQRSAGGAHSRDGFLNWFVKIGMGWAQPKPQWDKIHPLRVKGGASGWPAYGILFRCKAEILAAFAPFRTAAAWREAAFSWLRDHARKSIIPVYVRETTNQHAVWQERSIHSATEAVLVGVEKNSVVEYGPQWRGAGPPPKNEVDPGRRSRHGHGAYVTFVASELEYISKPPKTYQDRKFRLDPNPTRYVAIGGDKGYEDFLSTGGGGVLVPPHVDDPPASTDPEVSKWEQFLQWLKDLF